jgi:hypothetical protein
MVKARRQPLLYLWKFKKKCTYGIPQSDSNGKFLHYIIAFLGVMTSSSHIILLQVIAENLRVEQLTGIKDFWIETIVWLVYILNLFIIPWRHAAISLRFFIKYMLGLFFFSFRIHVDLDSSYNVGPKYCWLTIFHLLCPCLGLYFFPSPFAWVWKDGNRGSEGHRSSLQDNTVALVWYGNLAAMAGANYSTCSTSSTWQLLR